MNSDTKNRRKEPLLTSILEFRKIRNWIVVPLIVIGLFSLALPILPGIAFIFAGLLIWKPELAERMKNSAGYYYRKLFA